MVLFIRPVMVSKKIDPDPTSPSVCLSDIPHCSLDLDYSFDICAQMTVTKVSNEERRVKRNKISREKHEEEGKYSLL